MEKYSYFSGSELKKYRNHYLFRKKNYLSGGLELQRIILTGIIITLTLFSIGLCTAEKSSDNSIITGNLWNGTWESDNYSISIIQNGKSIAGSYEPKDPKIHDPGLLKGQLSEDGREFSGIWTEAGNFLLVLSPDKMTFTGVSKNRPELKVTESDPFTANGTRIGSAVDPNYPWTGSYKTKKADYTIIQNGTVVTGSYTPLKDIEDEPGIIEAQASEDGTKISGKWVETGKFSFVISDDLKTIEGTQGTNFTESPVIKPWVGRKTS